MKKLKVTAAVLAMVMLVATGCSATGKTEETTEETYSRTDIKDIRAQDDFYGYVNLATLKDLTIEPGNNSAGAIMSTETDDKLKEVVMEIVKDNKDYPNGSAEQIVKKAYEEYVAFDTDEVAKKAAADDVHKVIKEISDIKTRDELIEMAGKLYRDYCVNTFLLGGVKENDLDPEKYTVMFAQKPNLVGLDLEEISKDTTKAEKGEEAIIASLQVSGMERKEAEETAHSLMFLIIDIAWETDYEIVNAADPIAYSKSMDKSEIDKLLTNLTADQYEKLCGINENPYDTWVVIGEGQLAAIDKILTEENVEALKAWLMYDFVMSYGEFIKDDHKELKMYFPDSKEADEDQIYNYLNLYFGMELSDILVKYCYTDDQEELLNKLIEDIMDSYRDLIGNADWLSEDAREGLTEKLNGIIFITPGYCKDHIKDDPSKNDVFGDNFYETYINSSKKDMQYNIDHLGDKTDRLKQKMTMQTLNACYGSDNTVTICIGMMRDPWFNVNEDYYKNLGGLGSVLSHEIGHAFDSNCIKYDVNGKFDPSWIPSKDLEALENRNQSAIAYFEEAFPVYGVYYVDGKQTLGENYADLGGMEALMNSIEDKSKYKDVLESYASIWCMLMTEDSAIQQISDDSHSPSIIRVNAIVATLDEFYETYDVKEGDGMYISPDKRISRWR